MRVHSHKIAMIWHILKETSLLIKIKHLIKYTKRRHSLLLSLSKHIWWIRRPLLSKLTLLRGHLSKITKLASLQREVTDLILIGNWCLNSSLNNTLRSSISNCSYNIIIPIIKGIPLCILAKSLILRLRISKCNSLSLRYTK